LREIGRGKLVVNIIGFEHALKWNNVHIGTCDERVEKNKGYERNAKYRFHKQVK
jgi:hypothetical protein